MNITRLHAYAIPGQGIITLISDIAKSTQVEFRELRVDMMDPMDFNGVPYLDNDQNVQYAQLDLNKILQLKDDTKAIVVVSGADFWDHNEDVKNKIDNLERDNTTFVYVRHLKIVE